MQYTEKRLAIVSKFSSYGGVSKVVLHLANHLVHYGVHVDIIIAAGETPYPDSISSKISVYNWNHKHVYSSFPSLLRYIISYKPDAVLAIRHNAINLCLAAHLIAPNPNNRRLLIRLSGHVSSSISKKSRFRKWMHLFPLRHFYDKADSIIAVSHGVAEDFIQLCPQTEHKVITVPNPTIPQEINELASKPLNHPWLTRNSGESVVLGVGRFTKRKDFSTLIKAFARLRALLPCKLILLGDGAERDNYLMLAKQLNISQHIDLPGNVSNPYAYMARADLFVLSSHGSEGSPNALKEALALGLPAVSTDCPSGPREILANGQFGELSPPKDDKLLSEAMHRTLANPPDTEKLKSAVSKYTVSSSTKEYMRLLLPGQNI